MIEASTTNDPSISPRTGHTYLCLYGHFYQPPRENPFTGILHIEPEVTPYANFNEKITAECYRPNAEAGNVDARSYDLETLNLLAQYSITYTVLAPWQAATPIDVTEPYIVRLFDGRSITVFFYNAPLSGGVSFDWNVTSNADTFAGNYLPDQLVQSKREAGQPQLILIATDGELYGH